jgi:NitT/TauT family transport system ATP-binding protein
MGLRTVIQQRYRIQGVSRSFGPLEVLRDLSLVILHGEFLAIVGPSGCGKTTLLNLLSGFDRPTSGTSSGTIVRHGEVRMVYQQDGLFPWQTVAQNIALGLRHVQSGRARTQQVRELLRLIRQEAFEDHYPHQLSGGMRQLVELARALAGESDILLMDEPFSSLDYLTHLRMRQELARILAERPRTVVLVTHDIEEAAQLADRVIVLSEGPGRIRYQVNIPAPRPRDPTQPDVVRAMHQILTNLNFEHDADDYADARQKR